ncbi:MAG: ABC transporter permease [Chloroflexi bacterium]|nr:ABC transporter permease [Chloroflexota bacterium]
MAQTILPSRATEFHRSAEQTQGSRAGLIALLAAPALFVTLFILLPLGIMFLYSFWTTEGSQIVPQWTLEHYQAYFSKRLFYAQSLKSLRVAAMVTGTCLLLAYPVSYFIATRPARQRSIWLLLTTVPMWSSYIVRIYAWRTILGLDGVLNSALLSLGLLAEPSKSFSFNQFAVYITLTNYLLPFMIVPLVSTLEKIPPSIFQAARDLGSEPLDAFRRVLIPLSLPGVFVGCLNVFIVALADYLTPALVGGTDGVMIGNVIQSEFGASFNWPLGAAATYVTAAIAMILILTLRWLTHRRAKEVKF